MTRQKVQDLMDRWLSDAKNGIPVTIEYAAVQDAIDCLIKDVGKNEKDDPFRNIPNDLLIRHFAVFLRNLGEHRMSIHVFKVFYQKCLELESELKIRIHKGDTLHWIARFFLQINEYENSFKYCCLCFLDDVISECQSTIDANGAKCIIDTMDAPITSILQFYFHIPRVNLLNLKNDALEVLQKYSEILDPEHLIFVMRQEGKQVPRFSYYRYYQPPIHFLRNKYEEIKKNENAKELEKFAAYLFSSVVGFEPILDVKPGSQSYQFDVVVRNLTPPDFSITWLGDYFAIECKYYSSSSVGSEELNHFASKLKYHDFKCGILFTKTPISGWKTDSPGKAGKLVQTKIFNRQGIIVFDISEDDVSLILEGKNLIEVMIEKYEKVRLDL